MSDNFLLVKSGWRECVKSNNICKYSRKRLFLLHLRKYVTIVSYSKFRTRKYFNSLELEGPRHIIYSVYYVIPTLRHLNMITLDIDILMHIYISGWKRYFNQNISRKKKNILQCVMKVLKMNRIKSIQTYVLDKVRKVKNQTYSIAF